VASYAFVKVTLNRKGCCSTGRPVSDRAGEGGKRKKKALRFALIARKKKKEGARILTYAARQVKSMPDEIRQVPDRENDFSEKKKGTNRFHARDPGDKSVPEAHAAKHERDKGGEGGKAFSPLDERMAESEVCVPSDREIGCLQCLCTQDGKEGFCRIKERKRKGR